MTMTQTIGDLATAAAAGANLGVPSWRKSGRSPMWPYVPVVVLYGAGDAVGTGRAQTQQIKGVAFETRDQAVAAAACHIARQRADLVRKLVDPRYRALRRQYGLPEEIGA